MKITFDPSFDGGAWPGPAPRLPAVLGKVWVGETGLLGILEGMVGLSASRMPEMARIASLVGVVSTTPGFWSDSASADPFGTAARLLEWRDTLQLWGWSGEPVAPRLGELAAVTASAPAGVPDRLVALADHIRKRGSDVEKLTLFCRRAELAPRWRGVVDALEGTGTRVFEMLPEGLVVEPSSMGDLAQARIGAFVPIGDGSLQLIRPATPSRAAEAVSAWLAAQPSLEGTVVVGGDAILDAALSRHGLPRVGAPAAPDARLAVLPLVLAMGWRPIDPAEAHELLMLPDGPIPRYLANGLAAALREQPGVGGEAWAARLVCRLSKSKSREADEQWVDSIFEEGGIPLGDRMPPAEVLRRVVLVESWAASRRGGNESASWASVLDQCKCLKLLVQASGLASFKEADLRRITRSATAGVGERRAQPEAGLFGVLHPEAVAGPARQVIWWNFVREPEPRSLPLTPNEGSQLAGIGVRLPDRTFEAARRAARACRPWRLATERLVLVCPRLGEDGEPVHPHSMWDEIARRTDGAIAPLLREELESAPPRTTRKLLPLLQPRRDWAIDSERISWPEEHSPSSVGKLIECPLSWVFRSLGKLHGDSSTLPDLDRTIGNLVDSILGEVMRGIWATPEEAGREAARRFDSAGPRRAAALFLPGREALREATRHATIRSAEELIRLVQEHGYEIVSDEVAARYALFGKLHGELDLVLEREDGSRVPIDLKLGGSNYREASLKDGTALQLAGYSFLLARGAELPPGGYFIVKRRRLIGSPGLSGAFPIDGPSLGETWRAAERAAIEAQDGLLAGLAIAAGNASEAQEPITKGGIDEEGRLRLQAPCDRCDYRALCGRSRGEA